MQFLPIPTHEKQIKIAFVRIVFSSSKKYPKKIKVIKRNKRKYLIIFFFLEFIYNISFTMSIVSLASFTSCALIIFAPFIKEIVCAEIVPVSLSSTDLPVISPIKDFRDNPINTG